MKEIQNLSEKIENKSHFRYLVMSCYDRKITPGEFLEQSGMMKGAMAPALRFLFLMLLSFDDLKRAKNPVKISEILVKAINGKFQQRLT